MWRNAELKFYRGKWAAVWTEGGRTRRKSLRTGDRDEATRRLADWKRVPAGDLVSDIMAVYLADKELTATDPQRLKDAWKAARVMFGPLRPDQITRELCREYAAARLSQGRGAGTIRRELGAVRSGLAFAGRLDGAVFEMPPPPRPKERYLTRGEYGRLLDCAAAPHVRLFVTLALATGARAAALLGLTWDRVDFERGIIRLNADDAARRKGRATVPMTRAARQGLEEAREAALRASRRTS